MVAYDDRLRWKCTDPEGEWIAEQKRLHRKGCCLTCGRHKTVCECGQGERVYDRRDYSSQSGGPDED